VVTRGLVVAVLAHASQAHADASVTVALNAEGRALAQRLQLSVPELIAHAESRIDELYKISRLDTLLRSFGDTAAFTQRTLGVDYDMDPGDRVVGFAAAGVHGDVAIGTTNELLGGSIVNMSAMAGIDLVRFGHPRWRVFANGFYDTTTIRGLVGHLFTLGGHAQWQAVPPAAPSRTRWMGVAVTSGIEYAHWTVGTTGSIESHFTAQGATEHITIHMSSTGTLDVLAQTLTIPVEATTGVRLGKLVALYGGGAAALTAGNSTVTAELDSVLSYTHDRIPVGTATIVGSGEHAPSALAVYALGGVALHTRHVRAFLQGAVAPGELGVSVGLRLAL
jgi:hypothetical protein